MSKSRLLVTLEVWNCSVFIRKCTAIDTERSGKMADVWQMDEIRWITRVTIITLNHSVSQCLIQI